MRRISLLLGLVLLALGCGSKPPEAKPFVERRPQTIITQTAPPTEKVVKHFPPLPEKLPQTAQPDPNWPKASLPRKVGDAEIRAFEINYRKPLSVTKLYDNCFYMNLRVRNISQGKALNYNPWGTDGRVKLTDNKGTVYQRYLPPEGRKLWDGQIEAKTIQSGQSLYDCFFFHNPNEQAEFYRLELPAETVGGSGWIRLQIDKSMIGHTFPD